MDSIIILIICRKNHCKLNNNYLINKLKMRILKMCTEDHSNLNNNYQNNNLEMK